MVTDNKEQDALLGPNRYAINLPAFEGPLDLLLFLVRKHEVDIYDIPIHEVTCQYLNILRDLQRMNLEVAGEFFVMAATLMHVKSRMLLPVEEAESQQEEDDEGADPRWNLIQQLLEYQRFKEAAGDLQDLVTVNQDYLPRICENLASTEQNPLKTSDQIEVWNTFNAVLRRIAEKLVGAGEIHDENVTVASRMETVIARLQTEKKFMFSTLFKKGHSLTHLIASFLAILELSRLKFVVVEQNEHFTDIVVSAGERKGQPDDFYAIDPGESSETS